MRIKHPQFMDDMSTVMQHRQVVLLVCGLMSDPTPIIHLVYERWICYGQKSAGKTLIEAMFYEAGLPVPKDLLHNQWINYYDHSEGLIKDTSPVYVPSRWYQFHQMQAKVSCKIQHGDTDVPECTISIIEPHITVTKDLLSICHRICQHQAVRNLHLFKVKCEDLPESHVFTISKNTESMEITFCILPAEILSHLMQQIKECSALRVLNLSSMVPHLHQGLPELETLKLRSTGLNKEDLQHLSCITQSNKLPKLKILDLSWNTLTGCLTSFLPDPHPGLLELRESELAKTKLNKEDLQHLSHITQYNKLPSLQCLDLSFHTLTGCLTSFLPDPHPGLPELEKLDLNHTALNKEDLEHLTRLIQTHKLPGLKHLNLIGNRLSEMETDFEHLIEACVTHHQREVKLSLWVTRLSGSFVKKWKQRCAGTKIKLVF